MEHRFSRNLKLGYSFSFFMLVAVGLLSCLFIRNLLYSNREVAHSNQIMLKLEGALSLMKDAETGQRGYLLTGREQFLAPYRGAYQKALGLVAEATVLTRDNSLQQQNMAAIREIMTRRMSILQFLIDKRRQGGVLLETDLDAGKAAMDALRLAADRAEKDEQGLLTARSAALTRYAAWTPILIAGAILVSLLIALFSYISVIRDIREKERLRAELQEKEEETAAFNEELTAANEEITAANEELTAINEELTEAREELAVLNSSLEEKVAERTKALQESEEETQALNEELTAINGELAAANEEYQATNEELNQNREDLQRLIAELEASEQRSRSIVAAAPFPIGVYTGREMRILMANQAIMAVWGKGSEVIGKTYHEVLPELAAQDIYQQLDDVFVTGEPFHARNQRVDILVNGQLQPFYFNYSFTPLYGADGQVYGVMNTAAEITDLVLAKQQVEQSEENLKAMIAQAPVAMCILSGPDHVISVANRLIIALWGKPEAELMNKPVFEALPDARGQGLEEIMAGVYRTGETFYASELPVSLIRHGQAEVVYQNFVYQAYRDATGRIAGVIAITIDVTEQVLARQTIERSAAELREIKKRLEAELETSKQIQRQKDGFIGMASHELKTPLTTLNAIVQVANAKLRQNDDPFLAGAMEKANQQVRRMTTMINGFLNVSRLESGKIHIEQQTFDMETLIQDMVAEANLTVSTHLIHFVQCPPIQVNADRDKIGSVISNYISNAIKYSPRGKNIEIACKMKDDQVIFSVKDEGMGIKPDDLAKIFDRYYRVETPHTRHIAGFGIGLYLSSEIIQRHGGKVWAESESGVGSTFYFSLSLKND